MSRLRARLAAARQLGRTATASPEPPRAAGFSHRCEAFADAGAGGWGAALRELGAPHRPVWFLDLETSSWPGPIPFVVGLGGVGGDDNGDGMVVHQWTLNGLAAEADMLEAVAAVVAAGPRDAIWVTFNGSSFDVPVLETRFRRLRLPTEELRREHVDLLHVSRRIWRDTLADCRLATIEQERLGLHRIDDIPGAEVPAIFERWLADPDDVATRRDVAGVVEHNRLDITGLARLLTVLAEVVTQPRGLAEAFGVARHLRVVGAEARALALLSAAVVAAPVAARSRHALRDARWFAADLARRAKDYSGAAEHWAWICVEFPGDPGACEALAKHLEHRVKDPRGALAVAEASTVPCARRLDRLYRKVEAIESRAC
ncbi:MAG: ribonuclease H-like domain-containing protein [Deltaproteobacteria bacterium]|nr:ribonuclease H-like domain-containing protein [Deltaproteobacteria bacterium]